MDEHSTVCECMTMPAQDSSVIIARNDYVSCLKKKRPTFDLL